ncbi:MULTISPECIES: ABC transporter substrate-binding protein [Roseomonadaceae]|uniref:ABC transporter substrate-binding protein n=1 Tax=Falsiroseomonas oleicola TaxID=2801474 RepID=A0ABS6H9R0_9PROT|nr:ABC transporter substrate-binding protein [Roseomonas oleicola]MBU8544557.1 ABC transporter substrate-binding protein [Roseomonas oleicola]
MRRTLHLAALLLPLFATPVLGQTTLRIGIGADPNMLDPAQSSSFVERVVFAAMCDKLVDIGPDLQFRPELATAWEWAPDGRALTLTLREGARFQDGTPIDAAAVKANLDRYRTARESRRRTELQQVTSVETPDARTVRLVLSAPFAPLLSVLADRAGMMLSPAVLPLAERVWENPICSGPFRLTRRVAQDRIEMEKFAGHWNAANIHADRLVFLPIPDNNVRLLNLRAGQLDLIERVAPVDLPSVERDQRLRLVAGDSIAYQTISINVGHGPLAAGPLGSDARVREAFERSIDRAIINQVALEGRFTANNQAEPPGTAYHFPELAAPPRDPAAARALLRAAGHERVAFTLKVPNQPTEAQVAEIIQSMAAEGGFDIRIELMEAGALVAATQRGDYEASVNIWSGRPDPDGNIAPWVASNGFLNRGKYVNAEVDALFAAARAVTETARRQPLYRQAAALWMADRPYLMLYHYRWFWAMRRGVEGFVPSPDGIIRFAGLRVGR